MICEGHKAGGVISGERELGFIEVTMLEPSFESKFSLYISAALVQTQLITIWRIGGKRSPCNLCVTCTCDVFSLRVSPIESRNLTCVSRAPRMV